MSRKILQLSLLSLLLVFGIVAFGPKSTNALSGTDFTPGNLIDDALFYDGGAMTADQIQAFLNAKVPTCDTNGTQMHSSGITRAQRGINNGNPPPYTCLKDYRMNTTFKAGESGLCDAMPAKSNQSAAQIIQDVGRACKISQKALIVMLQKEQGLITDDWPWPVQYTKAMGYYCPDDPNNPGWCHPNYAGFFNQVYNAALQFQRYKADPNNWNHIPMANNNILYQANNPGCGARSVYIENYATAGLYNYTPYTPNQAALNNLYGTGDGCSAYGNRNFWRMYNDWFGSTRGSYLMRSVEDATVYLISGDYKHPIASLEMLNILSPLGSVKFVSQSYLNNKTTGQVVGRLLRSEDGTIYFHDSGIKLAFTSCSAIEHYGLGSDCGNYINLTNTVLSKLHSGPNMTRVFGTTSGKTFYIENAKKREIFDQASKTQTGITAYANVLKESAISYLAYGRPVIRNDVVVYSRGAADVYLYQQDVKNPLTGSVFSETALIKNLPKASLDLSSISQIETGATLRGFAKNTEDNQYYVLDKTGKANISNGSEWTSNYVSLSNGVLNSLANSNQPISNMIVKSPMDGTVYYVENAKKRAIHSWEDLLKLKPTNLHINTIPTAALSSIPNGDRLLGPSSLVKSPNNATVYIVDGTDSLYMFSTFLITENLGMAGSIATISEPALNRYSISNSHIGVKVKCGDRNYLASSGRLYEITDSMQSHYGFSFLTLSGKTCANLLISPTPLNRFLRTSDGTIYYVEGGTKRPITSYSKYIDLGGSSGNTTQISEFTAKQLSTGQLL